MSNKETEKLPIHPIQQRDNYICQYCGRNGLESLDDWHSCTVDHVIPVSEGGTDDESNLVTCCSYCNAIKGNKKFESFEAAKEYILGRRKELEETYRKVKLAVRGMVE